MKVLEEEVIGRHDIMCIKVFVVSLKSKSKLDEKKRNSKIKEQN